MTVRILHLHSTFAAGGKEARAVRLMNAFGAAARHTIISAMPGEMAAARRIAPDIDWRPATDAPPLAGRLSLHRLRALARCQRGFDLVLSYNWGAMDGVMANRLFDGPPLVHHEDGFNADEAERLKVTRNLYRRVALAKAAAVVVPSARLEAIARHRWKLNARLHRIGNGIAVADYAAPDPAMRAALGLRPGRQVVGTLAGLRAVKNLPRLVRAVAATGMDVDLAIVGEGPERAAIASAGAPLGDRLHMPGHLASPARYVGHFDVFALSSDSEQQPISVMEAMAAGLPVAAPAVGDIAAMVSEPNRRFIVAPGDEAALAAAIAALLDDRETARAVGEANRRKALVEFDERRMIADYRALYAGALGRPGALG